MIVESWLMGDDEIGTLLNGLLNRLTCHQKGDNDAGDFLCGITGLDSIDGIWKRCSRHCCDNCVNGLLNGQTHRVNSPVLDSILLVIIRPLVSSLREVY